MADVFVSRFLEKLKSIVLDGNKKKASIKSLSDRFTIIQGVLEDAEGKQVENQLWLEELKEIYYDVEDILDEWRTRSLIAHMQQSDPVIKKNVQSKLFNLFSCSCFKPHEIGIKIKELNKRLDGIVNKEPLFNLNSKQLFNHNQIQSNDVHRETCMYNVTTIYGRDDEKNILISKLLSESSTVNSHVPVISIVGTGGFGKTTLAQLILKDEKVKRSFDNLMMWVCVSDPFLFKNVAKEIIQQAIQGNVPNTNDLALQKNLSECVKGRHFILVLDDVWSCSIQEWLQLKKALDYGAAGSRIIVTSRSVRLAEMINSSYIHLLGQLSDDDCWSLFKSIAFSRRESDIDMYEDIGIIISKKCKGVPLVIKVLASIMYVKSEIKDWRDVSTRNIWDVIDGKIFLSSIMHALPSNLKPCLMYVAVFPKDAIFQKKEMVQLWMAQGYLGSDDDGSADLEMKGRDYFDYLAMLSFFQDIEKDGEGNITSCKMHDLVHDFVKFLTKNETIILEEENASCIKVRHLFAGDLGWSSIYQQKNLRTLRSFSTSTNRKENGTLTLDLLHQLQCLRVLSLRGYQFKELPSEVEQLLQLRYLDLSDNSMLEILPETICILPNLQTLKLKQCKFLRRLPEGIGKLSKLRYLDLSDNSTLEILPETICNLLNLQTLKLKQCKFLRRLPEGIGKLSKLRYLDLSDNSTLEILPETICNLLNLQTLKLKQCKFLRRLPEGIGKLSKLRYLDLSDISKLEILPETICNLLNLQTLKLKRCKSLTRLPEGIGKLSKLGHLEIEGCEFRPYYSQGCEFRTLDTFIVVVIDAHKIKEGCTFGDLKLLNHLDLEGHLKINGLGQVNDVTNAAQVELKMKEKILSLVLEFGWKQETEDEGMKMEEILEAFQPHTNLKKLVIKYYQGFKLPGWISSLSNLTVLTLMDLQYLQLPALGKLASLEVLHLHGLISVKNLGCEFYGLDDTLNRQVIPKIEEVDIIFPAKFGRIGFRIPKWGRFFSKPL